MDYSIIIPVFNKAGLTRNCLKTLPATLEGAGNGEVIVIDNASSDETPEVLAEFDWITSVRNETNTGFAAANNQGARIARGRNLVLLNNDTQATAGWLKAMLAVVEEPGVGVVGARLLFPNDTIQHAGVVVAPVIFGSSAIAPFHYGWQSPANDPDLNVRRDYQVVTGACMATPRELYLELGGLDEIYWNGYEDVDYCFKVGQRGLRVVYEPKATLYHFESQSGVQRFRKVLWNIRVLGDRWGQKVAFDSTQRYLEKGRVPVLQRQVGGGMSTVLTSTPPTSVLVHGARADFERSRAESELRSNRSPIASIQFCEDAEAVERARELMAVRGERYLAFVDARCRLRPGWLDELIAQSAAPPNVVAATFAAPELAVGQNVVTLATDARCTLLNLKLIPQHVVLSDFETLHGAVADLLLNAHEFGCGTRGASIDLGHIPPVPADASFARVRGRPIASVFSIDPRDLEAAISEKAVWTRPLVSIVTLSWNAPYFTEKALESIRTHTSEPYEVIVVDNGSGPETLEMLAAIDDPHVRVFYNEKNRGFGGGNNDGIARTRGEYVVILNNDVLVTDGWLEGLLGPFKRVPGVGVTAPRSNKVVGHQQLPDAKYDSEEELATFAATRRDFFDRQGYFADRAIGLCLCVSRTVLDQIGGFDERFEMGNFEDDDFCIRVRAAGYGIFVCDDVFIHHFGSQSFAANKVDYAKTMGENWSRFAEKWGYPREFPKDGYHPRAAFARGFDRKLHYFPLKTPADSEPGIAVDSIPADVRLVLMVPLREESDWPPVAEFVGRFARAFKSGDGVALSIATFGTLAAEAVGARVERIFGRIGIDVERSAHIEIADEEVDAQWRARFAGRQTVDVADLKDRSPSALRRLAAQAQS